MLFTSFTVSNETGEGHVFPVINLSSVTRTVRQVFSIVVFSLFVSLFLSSSALGQVGMKNSKKDPCKKKSQKVLCQLLKMEAQAATDKVDLNALLDQFQTSENTQFDSTTARAAATAAAASQQLDEGVTQLSAQLLAMNTALNARLDAIDADLATIIDNTTSRHLVTASLCFDVEGHVGADVGLGFTIIGVGVEGKAGADVYGNGAEAKLDQRVGLDGSIPLGASVSATGEACVELIPIEYDGPLPGSPAFTDGITRKLGQMGLSMKTSSSGPVPASIQPVIDNLNRMRQGLQNGASGLSTKLGDLGAVTDAGITIVNTIGVPTSAQEVFSSAGDIGTSLATVLPLDTRLKALISDPLAAVTDMPDICGTAGSFPAGPARSEVQRLCGKYSPSLVEGNLDDFLALKGLVDAIPGQITAGVGIVQDGLSTVETNLGNQVTGVQSTLGTQVNGVQSSLGSQVGSVETNLSSRIENIAGRVNAKVSTLTGTIGSLNGTISSLGREINSLNDEIDNLNDRINDLTSPPSGGGGGGSPFKVSGSNPLSGDALFNLTEDAGSNQIPESFSLDVNYPNPFNPTTNIQFALPETSDVMLRIYDMLGRQVATLVDQSLDAGYHTIQWDASRLASGTYIYRLWANGKTFDRQMVLNK